MHIPITADSFFRTAVFMVMNGALGIAAGRLARRLLPSARVSTRLAAAAICFVAAIIVLTQFLTLFGLYTWKAAGLVSIVLAIAARTLLSEQSRLQSDFDAVWNGLSRIAAGRGAILLVMSLVAFALAAWRALAHPPLGWDSLTYHLVFAAKYVQAGRLVAFDGPAAMDYYSHFPKNGEIIASWLMLPFSSDLLVGIMNVALLSVGGLATYGVGRELELTESEAALAAAAVCASPFLFSYVTTNSPDTLVYTMLLSAILFLIRYLKEKQSTDALLVCAAVGVALGAKFTALPIGGLLIFIVVVASAMQYLRSRALTAFASLMLVCCLIVMALGARQYVLNTRSTGNPIYPIPIVSQLTSGSPYTDQLESDKGRGDRRRDLFQIIETFNYFPDWRTPTSAGPKFLILIPLALLGIVVPTGKWTWLLRMLVVVAMTGIVVAYLPGSGFAALSRRFWPGSTPRFLATSFGIFTIAGLVVASRLQPWRREVVLGMIVAFVAWDFMIADTSLVEMVPLEVGVVAGCSILVMLIYERVRRGLPNLRLAAFVLFLLLMVPMLNARRAEYRWHDYAKIIDTSDIPRDFVHGWQYCDGLAPNSKLALTAGWSDAGQNYFFYPLMGSHLQNEVTYVPIDPSVPPGSEAYVRRIPGDPSRWIGEIRQQRVTHVFVQSPWPTEDSWMRDHSEIFTLVASDKGFHLYQVRTL
jgi:hypothetical protein